ncbi:MAG: hypothetical protein ACPL5I_04050 [Thermodesulfobacteriota bacterium]
MSQTLEKDPVAAKNNYDRIKFLHPPLQEPVNFFGGWYLFLEEGRLPYRDKEVLYLLGVAVVESSCCGPGGCIFIKVPGYVHSWKKEFTASGQYLSEIESIASTAEQKEITKLLFQKHPECGQVDFI